MNVAGQDVGPSEVGAALDDRTDELVICDVVVGIDGTADEEVDDCEVLSTDAAVDPVVGLSAEVDVQPATSRVAAARAAPNADARSLVLSGFTD